MKDWSQSGEQAHILAAFVTGYPEGSEAERRCIAERGNKFLDIGAYHPTDKSNTRALFDLGWSGIMIEPSPGPMRALLQEYGNESRITLIQACVSQEEGLVQLRVSDDAVSSIDAGVQDIWKEKGGYFGSMLVPAITFEQLGNQFGGAFDFVNIDAEGTSVVLCLKMLALGWEPRCFCCETDGQLEQLAIAATGRGYRLVFSNGCNAVFVKGAA